MTRQVGAGLTTILLLLSASIVPSSAARATVLHGRLIGVNMHPLQENYALKPSVRALRLAAQEGASVVRIDIHWSWFEWPGPGVATWYQPEVTDLDQFLGQAARLHIRVLATVLDTPCWAAARTGQRCGDPATYRGNHPPLSPASFAGFLRRLVAHVGDRIQYYEIWNEPNLPRFWLRPDPRAYTRLLQASYRAIKAENPSATVLGGATSGADVPFIRGMYRAGAKSSFDALSVHPYSSGRSPRDCSVPLHSFACGVAAIHAVMARYGDPRPIWLTEFGSSIGTHSGDSAQASYLASAAALIAGWPYVRGAVWYELFDDPTGHDGEHFGLFDGSLHPRPAARTFRRWADGSP